ncbi:MAG TPA: lipopolysaccharide heptosyltransferase II [Casimicrobiaceae bacterium]|nr:lipopolysaccharide heptosyltransferase II [Casimicrobiaceae bacterium]
MSLLRDPLPPRGRRRERPPLKPNAQREAHAPGSPGAHTAGDRALVIAPSWVGDAILSEPLIAQLRRSGMTAPVDVVAPPWCGPVYARMRGIGRVIDSPAGHGRFALAARRRLGLELREARYTHGYVLPNTWKSALVPFFARIPNRIGFVGEARYGLLTDARSLDVRAMPQLVIRYASLAAPRGAPPPAAMPPVLVPDTANLAAALEALGVTRRSRIAILCPGAEFGPAKRWPVEHFAALAKLLAGDGYALWIVGSPNDRPVASALLAALGSDNPGVADLTGRTDLGTAIDLMAAASLVVSNDSGLMHAAAAVGARLVALFGSSSPEYTPPLSPTAKIARIEIECSPCFKRECPLGHFRCMRELTPQLVYNLARSDDAAESAAAR